MSGGVVYLSSGASVDGFARNSGARNDALRGGVAYIGGYARLHSNHSSFADSRAAVGAGIFADATALLESRNDTLVGLRATGAGGALYAGILAEVTVVGGRFERCASETSVGGALYAENVALLRVERTAFRANTAAVSAGALYATSSSAELVGCAFEESELS